MGFDDEPEELFTDRPQAVTDELAHACGFSVDAFVDTYGAGWQVLPDMPIDFDADPEGVGNLFGPWYVSGEPFQLALRPHERAVEVGLPVGRWLGHRMVWQVHRRVSIPHGTALTEAGEVAARLVKARRSAFHYCRYCRVLTPPEERLSPDVCYGCGSIWQGVVY